MSITSSTNLHYNNKDGEPHRMKPHIALYINIIPSHLPASTCADLMPPPPQLVNHHAASIYIYNIISPVDMKAALPDCLEICDPAVVAPIPLPLQRIRLRPSNLPRLWIHIALKFGRRPSPDIRMEHIIRRRFNRGCRGTVSAWCRGG